MNMPKLQPAVRSNFHNISVEAPLENLALWRVAQPYMIGLTFLSAALRGIKTATNSGR